MVFLLLFFINPECKNKAKRFFAHISEDSAGCKKLLRCTPLYFCTPDNFEALSYIQPFFKKSIILVQFIKKRFDFVFEHIHRFDGIIAEAVQRNICCSGNKAVAVRFDNCIQRLFQTSADQKIDFYKSDNCCISDFFCFFFQCLKHNDPLLYLILSKLKIVSGVQK